MFLETLFSASNFQGTHLLLPGQRVQSLRRRREDVAVRRQRRRQIGGGGGGGGGAGEEAVEALAAVDALGEN